MITKGIIKSIDLLGNTCKVHIPFFETAGNDPIIETATVSNTPGSYNGYKVGDVVYVAFEDGSMSTPVVIGKLYLGTEKEKADPRGVSNVEESAAAKKATLPADSKLTAEIDSNVPNTTVPYSSLSSIANGLNTLNTNVGQMDRDYGNRFKQVISDIEGNKSTLEQTSKNMVAKVSGYKVDENGEPIRDEDGKLVIEEFGWELDKNSWTVSSQTGPILEANSEGLEVTGTIKATDGDIGKFIIGKIHNRTDDEGNEVKDENGNPIPESGIYTDNYIDCFKQTPGAAKDPTKPNGEKFGETGVYIGTDGIKLGTNFSVDPEGNVFAKSLAVINGSDEEIFTTDTTSNIVKLAGFTVTKESLYSYDKKTVDSEGAGVYIGLNGISIGNGFKVTTSEEKPTNVSLSEEILTEISAVSYWLASSCTVHTGTKQNENIVVTAMKKVGGVNEEKVDEDAYIWWKYKNTSSTWTLAAVKYRVNFTFPDETPDDDILIIATHNSEFNPNTEGIDISTDENIYEREEIPFSPLNTPILNLTNDSAALAYDGNNKIGSDTVSSTAELWLNGSKITSGVTYTWDLVNCTDKDGKTGTDAVTGTKVEIKTLSANTATATCKASYNGESFTKVFTITKQFKGNAGVSPITLEIENDYDSIPCTTEGVIDSNYDYATNTKHKLRLFEGTTAKAFKVAASRPTSENTDYIIVYSIETGITASLTSRTTANSNAYEASITGLTTDKAKINYTVYYGTSDTVLATGCFTAEKRYAGDAAVDYYILADQTQVLYNPNTNTYTPSDRIVNFTFWKNEGNNNPVPLTDSTFTYSINGGPKTAIPTTGAVECTITSTNTISLYTNDTLLDTETVSFIRDGQDGSASTVPGPPGRSVVSTIRYYKLCNEALADGNQPENNVADPTDPDNKAKADRNKGWQVSPPTFVEGYDYYETTRTKYTDADGKNPSYSWSTPVQSSMLTVDFINSLGITAKKIEVLDTSGTTVFKADGFIENPEVQIGGFNVAANKLTAGSGNGYVSLQTTQNPLEYTPAEYIEFSGTQYIDTGVIIDYDNDVVEITVQPTVAEQNGMFFGVWDAANSTGEKSAVFYHYGESGGTHTIMLYVGGGKIQNLNSTIPTTDLTKHTYRFEKKTNYELSVDGITKATTETNWTIDPESSRTSCIGAAYNADGVANWRYQGRIYRCKIWRGGQLYRDFIPVWKEGYGLYDNCFGKFYPNNGTGKIGGALVHSLDATFTLNGIKYTRLDYIQNNGIDNYIDTGLTTLNFTTGFTVEAEVMPTEELGPDARCCVLSSHFGDNTQDSNNISLELYEEASTDVARAYINQGHPNVTCGTIQENSKNKIKYDVVSSRVSVTVNGTTGQANATLAGPVNAPPYIFVDRRLRFGAATQESDKVFTVPMRLYSMKVYSGGTLIAHYLPVLNGEQVPGLVNLTTGQFLTTPSGSPFTYGAYESKAGRVFVSGENSYRELEYIESPETSDDKAAYINTGEKTKSTTAIEIDAMIYQGKSYYGGTASKSLNCTTGGDGLNYFYHYDSAALGKSSNSVIRVRTVVKQDGKNCYRDGVLVATATNSFPDNYEDTNPILLGGRCSASGVLDDAGGIRIYACKIWQNGNLVKDFIPVIENETTYGLYDQVNKQFYKSANTDPVATNFTGKGYDAEFTAFYLGAPEPELAPFSVTNTGKLKAESGDIGGFELSETGIRSNNGNLQLESTGNIIADTGTIGGLILNADGLRSKNNDLYLSKSGNIKATTGTIGPFTLSKEGFSGHGISILGDQVAVALKDSKITLRTNTTEKRPEIQFSGGTGAICNADNTSGIIFSSGVSVDTFNFLVVAEMGGTDWFGRTARVKLFSEIKIGATVDSNYTYTANNKTWYLADGVHGQRLPNTNTIAVFYYWRWSGDGGQGDLKRFSFQSHTDAILEYDIGIYFNITGFGIKKSLEVDLTNEADAVKQLNACIGTHSLTDTANVYGKSIMYTLGSLCPELPKDDQNRALFTYYLGTSDRPWDYLYIDTGYVDCINALTPTGIQSDQKIKNTIKYDISKYDKIFDTLKPVSYKYNYSNSDRTHLGFIAQDVQASIQSAGLTDKDCAIIVIDGEGFDSKQGKVIDEEKTQYYVRYEELHALEVRQIQLLKEQVKQQETRITELEEIIKSLKTE